jgi:hypothetical protein
MATKVIDVSTCDDCGADDLHEVPAPHHHVISINGGPFKRLDFCAPSDRAVMGRLLRLYEEQGAELTLELAKEEPPKKALAAPARKQKERKKQEELEQAPPAEDEAPVKEERVICMEHHKSNGGMPLEIQYKKRSAHIDKCHPEKKIWEIEWHDPDKILQFPCTVHKECEQFPPLAFTTPQGLSSHKHSSPLHRTDAGADE